ncbi:ATP-grasp domain-containing protein [Kitasatospora mediocidica]|uniref:ATP-grasp domain-containing protein n=1 Tax=Kitasatospora mediocidica TaxID=58352 RepID=UPI00069016BB|nr:ATP-grasp domain-containing protein [Kitasatospora mediocidica]
MASAARFPLTPRPRPTVIPTPTVLLLGATDEAVRTAKQLGLRTLLVEQPHEAAEVRCTAADAVRFVDYRDWGRLKPVVRELHAWAGLSAAVSLTGAGLENAGRINDLFRLGGTGYAVAHRMRDRRETHRQLVGAGALLPGAAPLAERDDLDAFGARYGYPYVVRPRVGPAADFLRVDGPQAAERVWREVCERGARDFLMEEYLDGPEFGVASFSFAGRHVVVAITETFLSPNHFTALGHAVPARLNARDEQQIRAAVVRFLDLVGFEDGVCHTAVRLTARGTTVTDSQNPQNEELLHELVHAAYGVDLVAHALGRPFRLLEELPGDLHAYAGACARAVVGGPGVVESVRADSLRAGYDGVLRVHLTVRPGDRLRGHEEAGQRLGVVAVTGPDTSSAVRRAAQAIRDGVRVDVRDAGQVLRAAVEAVPEPWGCFRA